MAYTFYETRKDGTGVLPPLSEQHYGYSNVIKFTYFTSCIGVVAKVGNTLCGIHLVITGSDLALPENQRSPTPFNAFLAQEIRSRLFKNQNTEALIIGYIDIWKAGGGGRGEGFNIPPNQDVINGYNRLKFGFINFKDKKSDENRNCRVFLNNNHIEWDYWS